jgi:hypothetical protein
MSISTRLNFLNSIGLTHDPFATPVAEQEASSIDDIPTLYSYYLHPKFLSAGDLSITEKSLRQMEKNLFIYGEPGDGKTTLRLVLEAECRTQVEKTLAVTYLLGEDIKRPLTIEEHGVRLAKAIAVDLFIQIIEQFNSTEQPVSKKQIEVLQKQVGLGARQIQRLINLILDNNIPNARAGLGAYWGNVGRCAVQYVPKTDAIVEFLQKCLEKGKEKEVLTDWDLVAQGFYAARLWGFKRILIMVDGVDTRRRTPKAMCQIIEPLFEKLAGLAAQDVYFRFFLPLEIKKTIERTLRIRGRLQNYKYVPIIIKWQEDSLRRLLAQRFSAAGSHMEGLDALAERDLDVDDKLVTAAKNSPRRLLQLASGLIDIYVARKPGETRISAPDWINTLANRIYD